MKTNKQIRVENSLCGRCGRESLFTKTLCKKCNNKRKKSDHKNYLKNKALGKCKECGSTDLVTQTQCGVCKEKRKHRDKEKQQTRIKSGLCKQCGIKKVYTKTLCKKCSKWFHNAFKRRKELGLCSCGQPTVNNKTRCQICLDKQNKKCKEIKKQAYAGYGGFICNCCRVTEEAFLSLDHIANDGAKQRQTKHPYGGINLYRWIVANNFPQIFQILCHNCQWGKRIHGVCPHKKDTL